MNKLNINTKKIIKSISAFLVFYLLPYIIIFILKLVGVTFNNITNSTNVIINTILSLITAIILFIIYKKDFKEDFIKFKSDFIKNIDTGFKCWFVGLIIMMISNIILTFLLKAGGANNEQAVQSLLSSLPAIMAIDICLSTY